MILKQTFDTVEHKLFTKLYAMKGQELHFK